MTSTSGAYVARIKPVTTHVVACSCGWESTPASDPDYLTPILRGHRRAHEAQTVSSDKNVATPAVPPSGSADAETEGGPASDEHGTQTARGDEVSA